jgi:hypothetical protein
MIASFIALLHVAAALKLLVQPLSCLPRTSTSVCKPQHVADAVNMIDHRPLVDDHMHTLKV